MNTALFPSLTHGADDDQTEAMRGTWLRWYLDTFADKEERVREVWSSVEDTVLDERIDLGGDLSFFHDHSRLFPFLMAKLELSNLVYYKQLRECLHLRPVRKSRPVFLLGPTAGGEIEVIGNAGGKPFLVHDDNNAFWRVVCEERLFDNGVWYENASTDDFRQNLVNSRYVVISPWIADPSEAVSSAYNALGEHGFVFFPTTQVKMVSAAAALGLRRQDDFQETVAVYFKYPGARDVCDEE